MKGVIDFGGVCVYSSIEQEPVVDEKHGGGLPWRWDLTCAIYLVNFVGLEAQAPEMVVTLEVTVAAPEHEPFAVSECPTLSTH